MACTPDACLQCVDLLLMSVRRSGKRKADLPLPADELSRELARYIPFGSLDPLAFAEAEPFRVVGREVGAATVADTHAAAAPSLALPRLPNGHLATETEALPSMRPLHEAMTECAQRDTGWHCSAAPASHRVCGHEGTLSLESPTYRVDEGAGTLRVAVRRTGGGVGTVTVAWALEHVTTNDADVSAGTWYTTARVLVFAAGEVRKSFEVTVHEDRAVEGDEVFRLHLLDAGGGATLGPQRSTRVVLADNEAEETALPASSSLDNFPSPTDPWPVAGTNVPFTVTLASGAGSSAASLTAAAGEEQLVVELLPLPPSPRVAAARTLVEARAAPEGDGTPAAEALWAEAERAWEAAGPGRRQEGGRPQRGTIAATDVPGTYDAAVTPTQAGTHAVRVQVATPGAVHASYFPNVAQAGPPAVERWEPSVNFTWGRGPLSPGMGVEQTSARFDARVAVTTAGTWAFRVLHHRRNRARLWVAGSLLLDSWDEPAAASEADNATAASGLGGDASPVVDDHGTTLGQLRAGERSLSGSLPLDTGALHALRLDFRAPHGPAALALQWMAPGDTAWSLVPPSALYAARTLAHPTLLHVGPSVADAATSRADGVGLSRAVAGRGAPLVVRLRDGWGNPLGAHGASEAVRVRARFARHGSGAAPSRPRAGQNEVEAAVAFDAVPSDVPGSGHLDAAFGSHAAWAQLPFGHTAELPLARAGLWLVEVALWQRAWDADAGEPTPATRPREGDANWHNVSGSPFAVDVAPASASPGGSEVLGDIATAGAAVAGTPLRGELLCRDSLGNAVGSGGQRVELVAFHRERAAAAQGHTLDLGNGSHALRVTPSVAGAHRVAVTLGGVPVAGSPFEVQVAPSPVPNATFTTATGAGAREARSGQVATLTLHLRDAFGNGVATGGHGAAVEGVVVAAGAAGGAGVAIPAADAPVESWLLDGTIATQFGQAAASAPGGLTPFAHRVRRSAVANASAADPVTVTADLGNGTYTLQYTPTAAGPNHLWLFVNGTAIAHSPLRVAVADGVTSAAASRAAGLGLESAIAGTEAQFTITARDAAGNARDGPGAGGDAFGVRFTGLSLEAAAGPALSEADGAPHVVVTHASGAEYTVAYTLTRAGNYSVAVTLGGDAIGGSPFGPLRVAPAATSPVASTLALPSGARAGQSVQAVVTARDRFGNLRRRGGDAFALVVWLAGARRRPLNATSSENEENEEEAVGATAATVAASVRPVVAALGVDPLTGAGLPLMDVGASADDVVRRAVASQGGEAVFVGVGADRGDGTYDVSFTPPAATAHATVRALLAVPGGLDAEYYRRRGFSAPAFGRVEAPTSLLWGTSGPAAPAEAQPFPVTAFSAQWWGLVRLPRGGSAVEVSADAAAAAVAGTRRHPAAMASGQLRAAAARVDVDIAGARLVPIMTRAAHTAGPGAGVALRWRPAGESAWRGVPAAAMAVWRNVTGAHPGAGPALFPGPLHPASSTLEAASLPQQAPTGAPLTVRVHARDESGNVRVNATRLAVAWEGVKGEEEGAYLDALAAAHASGADDNGASDRFACVAVPVAGTGAAAGTSAEGLAWRQRAVCEAAVADGDGHYSLTFTPAVTGEHLLHIFAPPPSWPQERSQAPAEAVVAEATQGGWMVRSSPFRLRVVPAVASGAASGAVGDGLARATAGAEASFTVTVRDAAGNRRAAGVDAGEVRVRFVGQSVEAAGREIVLTAGSGASESGNGTVAAAEDGPTGDYTVRYRLLRAGQWRVEVSVRGEGVGDSPFALHVSPAALSPPHTVATGPGVEAASGETAFTVIPRDAWGNARRDSPHWIWSRLVGAADTKALGEVPALPPRDTARYTVRYTAPAYPAGPYSLHVRVAEAGDRGVRVTAWGRASVLPSESAAETHTAVAPSFTDAARFTGPALANGTVELTGWLTPRAAGRGARSMRVSTGPCDGEPDVRVDAAWVAMARSARGEDWTSAEPLSLSGHRLHPFRLLLRGCTTPAAGAGVRIELVTKQGDAAATEFPWEPVEVFWRAGEIAGSPYTVQVTLP